MPSPLQKRLIHAIFLTVRFDDFLQNHFVHVANNNSSTSLIKWKRLKYAIELWKKAHLCHPLKVWLIHAIFFNSPIWVFFLQNHFVHVTNNNSFTSLIKSTKEILKFLIRKYRFLRPKYFYVFYNSFIGTVKSSSIFNFFGIAEYNSANLKTNSSPKQTSTISNNESISYRNTIF